MTTITCDRCDQPFEADPQLAGTKMECPHCGDINRVPEVAAKPAPPEPKETSAERGEEVISVIRPAMFRAHPFRYLFLVALFLGGIAIIIAAGLMAAISFWLIWVGGLLALIGLIGWLWWYMAATVWIRVEISNKRTIRFEGIVRRHSTEVLHDHVRSVDIQQTFLQRLFNVGYLGIDSAGQDEIEIEVRDIPGPYKVKEIIDRYREM